MVVGDVDGVCGCVLIGLVVGFEAVGASELKAVPKASELGPEFGEGPVSAITD